MKNKKLSACNECVKEYQKTEKVFEQLLKAAKHYSVCDVPDELSFQCKDCIAAQEAIFNADKWNK